MSSGLDCRNIALFLDVDGTLLEFASTPSDVVTPPATIELLRALAARTEGAMALISGRSIQTLDELFAPLQLPAGGLHGFERRTLTGTYHRPRQVTDELLASVRTSLSELVRSHPQLLLEDKQFAMALHYRRAPELQPAVEEAMASAARIVGADYEVQRGQKVVELRPTCATKARAVAAFMQESPFANRRPVMIGDDLTDECAFEWVNSVGGLSIVVGDRQPSAAAMRLAGVAQVHAWLRQLLAACG